jgi:geranylgeranyl diphosphate synthase type II
MHTISFLQAEIEKEINALHFGKEPQNLYEPMTYILTLGGKRMRPLFVLLGCELFGGDYRKAMHAAMGIELFHNFTLLHDDIMDKALMRRNKQTVHVKWNRDIAILSGDALFVKACSHMMLVDDAVLRNVQNLFYKTAMEVCEGQQLDMDFEKLPEVTPDEYLNMITLKTAVLLACSLQTGAMIAGAVEQDSKLIYDFGKNIGIAFQLQDDLLDAFGDKDKVGKKIGGDINEGKKTFLFSEACQLLKGKQRMDFIALYNATGDAANTDKIEKVKTVFEQLELKSLTQQTVKTYVDKALNSLHQLKGHQQNVVELTNFCEQLLVREL